MKFLSGKMQSKLLLRFLFVSSVLLLVYSVIWIIIARNQIINTAKVQRELDIRQTEKSIERLGLSDKEYNAFKQNLQQQPIDRNEILKPLNGIILFAVLLFGSSLVFAALLSLTVEN